MQPQLSDLPAPQARAASQPWPEPLVGIAIPETHLDIPLSRLDLTEKTRMVLAALGAETFSDLPCLTVDEYLAVKGAGIRSVERLRKATQDAIEASFEEPDAEAEAEGFVIEEELPGWVLDTPLSTLDLTASIREAVTRNGGVTVRDLLSMATGAFLGSDNVGAGSLARLRAEVSAYARERLPDSGAESSRDPDAPLMPSIRASLSRLAPREADIMGARAGIDRPAESLQEIGDRLGVTRERIRQVEAKTFRHLRRISHWVETFESHLRGLAPNAPFTVESLLLRPWCAGMGVETAAYLVRTLGEPVLHVTETNRRPLPGMEGILVVPMPAAPWARAVVLARRALDEAAMEPSIEAIREAVSRSLSEELDEDARLAAMRYVGLGEGAGLTLAEIQAANVSRRSTIRSILSTAEGPLTLTEIHRRLQEVEGEDTGAASLRNTLATEAYWLGGELYGSLRDVEAVQDPDAVVAEAIAIMRTSPHRRWRAEQIVAKMREDSQGNERVPAIVAHILRTSGGVTFHGHGNFSLTEASGGLADASVQDAVEAILEATGTPMPWTDIRDVLRRDRGVRDNAIVSETGRLFRVDRGLWGLVDRDMPLSAERRVEIVRRVGRFEITDETTIHHIHESLAETGADMTDLTVSLLGYVLRTSGAYEFGCNGKVRPPGAGQARAGSCRQVVQDIIREARVPMTSDEVAVATSLRIGYLPAHSTVRLALLEVARPDDSVRPRVWRYEPGERRD